MSEGSSLCRQNSSFCSFGEGRVEICGLSRTTLFVDLSLPLFRDLSLRPSQRSRSGDVPGDGDDGDGSLSIIDVPDVAPPTLYNTALRLLDLVWVGYPAAVSCCATVLSTCLRFTAMKAYSFS
jgi:hypothetical protein